MLRSGNYLISAQVPVLFHVSAPSRLWLRLLRPKKRHSSLNICLLTFDIWQICLQGGSCWNRAECLPAYHGCQLFRNSPAHQAHGRSKYTVQYILRKMPCILKDLKFSPWAFHPTKIQPMSISSHKNSAAEHFIPQKFSPWAFHPKKFSHQHFPMG